MKQTCSQCKQNGNPDTMVQFGETWVCANCKPTFAQRLQEGVEDKEEMKVKAHTHTLFYRALGGMLLIAFLLITPLLVKWSSMIIPGNGKFLMPIANLVGLAAYLTASLLFVTNKRMAPVFLLVSYSLGFLGLSISYVPFLHKLVPIGGRVYALWASNLVIIVIAFVLRPLPKDGSNNSGLDQSATPPSSP